MNQIKDNLNLYLEYFEAFSKSLDGESESKIHSIRKNAIEEFAEIGFPTTRNEEWRFTNITPITKIKFLPVSSSQTSKINGLQIEDLFVKGLEKNRMVFVNGSFVKEFSTDNSSSGGVKIGSLSEYLQGNGDYIQKYITKCSNLKNETFVALNTAFVSDGAFIVIPDKTVFETPLYLVFVSSDADFPFISQPRNLIVIGDDSRVSVVEHYIHLSDTVYLTNTVTELFVGQNSVVEHTKLQDESPKAFHIGSTFIRQNSGSNFTQNSLMFGGAIARNNVFSALGGEGIECTLNGLSMANGEQLLDNHTTIDHLKPHCTSRELYKSILNGKSKGVFNGKIYVRKNAQKTDSKQMNKILLLSDNATMNTKPQLEIFADDVKCTHGAAIGYLDADSIFYLRSRGITEELSRDILTHAFANDILYKINVESLREYLSQIVSKLLRQERRFENH